MNQVIVVTVDGPSGAGKGTLSRLLAEALGFHLLDSGALYRLVALAAHQKKLDLADEGAIADLARHLDVVFSTRGEAPCIYLEGEEVTAAIRTENISMLASEVAAMPAVREALLERQRAFARAPGLVADGRDMGTTVFPGAQCKIFLTASAEARAERRYLQLQQAGVAVDRQALVADIRDRDYRDQSRSASPLKPAPDAHIIDSTLLTIPEVLQRMLALVDAPAADPGGTH